MKAAKLPALPSFVTTTHGDVVVLMVENLCDPENPKEPLFGYWDPFKRVISIRTGLHPTAAWLTLWHEKTHADLSEIGVRLSKNQEESICNALAAARLAEMLLKTPVR